MIFREVYMQRNVFNFFLYRINKEYRQDIFRHLEPDNRPDDDWLKEFLSLICNREFDYKKETKKATYTWSLRTYQDLNEDFSSIVLARSQLQKKSSIVTDNSIITGESVSNPPPADTIILLIFWKRHIVIVENRAGMTTGETWLRNFHLIVDNAMLYISIPVVPRLEPIPIRGTILGQLKSLDRVFRFRVRLKLPNPELTHWARRIYNEMIEERLTEYLQEFYSPNGIKVDESSKAYSSGALAESGYKEGGVRIEGEKNGKIILIDEGKTAIKGRMDEFRSYIRGLETVASGKKLAYVLNQIENEVNRLFPNEE
jgi:hypothetical protein